MHHLTRATQVVLGLGLTATWVALVRAGGPGSSASPGWYLAVAALAVWTATPYAVLGLAVRRVRGSSASGYILAVGALGVTGVAMYLGYRRALTDLVFLFLPLWQLAGTLLSVGLARSRR